MPDGLVWWRAETYEIVGGTHVAPVEGSPVEAYSLEENESAYQLLELAETDRGDEGGLLRWCERWGLLGVLQQRSIRAVLHPRWEVEGYPDFGGDQLQAVQPEFVRDVGSHLRRPRGATRRLRDQDIGRALGEDELESARLAAGRLGDMIPPPGTLLVSVDGEVLDRSTVDGVIQFFPRIAGVVEWVRATWEAFDTGEDLLRDPRFSHLPTLNPPLPGQPGFWEGYGEPLHVLWDYADRLQLAKRFWKERTHSHAGGKTAQKAGSAEPVPPSILHGIDGNRPRLRPATDRWEREWEPRSLYAWLHLRIAESATLKKNRFGVCAWCPREFIGRPNKKYCDDRCKKNAQMHRYRQT